MSWKRPAKTLSDATARQQAEFCGIVKFGKKMDFSWGACIIGNGTITIVVKNQTAFYNG